jgi:hypothetical protein
MSELKRKLQLGDRSLRVSNPPEGFRLDAPTPGPDEEPAVLLFVRTRAELEAEVAPALEAARSDRLTWIAYPKAGQLGTDLNRDSLADAMVARGVRPVRQVAIDSVWSALRFRPGSGS